MPNKKTLHADTPTLTIMLLLAGLAAIGPFSIDTYLPAFPEMAKGLDAKPEQIQQTLSVYLFTFGLMTLWHGAISDSLGRRRVILVGVAAYGLASLGCMLAPSIGALWAMRALQGVFAGVGMVVSRAMVRDLYKGATAQRLMSRVALMFAVAPALAPIIGGWLLAASHWRSIFGFLVVGSAVLFFFCWRHLPESLPPERRQPFAWRPLLSGYREVLGRLAFWAICGGIGLFFCGYFVYILAAPMFVREHLGLSATQFYWLFVPGMVGMMIGSWLCGRVAGRWSDKKALGTAFGLMLLAALINLALSRWLTVTPSDAPWVRFLPVSRHVVSLLLVVAPLALYNLGVAFAIPICTLRALDLFQENRRGTAASAQSFVQTMINTLISAFVVQQVWHNRMNLAWSMVVLCVLGSSLAFLGVMKRGKSADEA